MTNTTTRPYYLDLSGELLNYVCEDPEQQPPLTDEQLAIVGAALTAPHQNGAPSGILAVTVLKNADSELSLRLSIDPAVFVGPAVWVDVLAEISERPDCTAEAMAIETYLSCGPLDELAHDVQVALGVRDYDFTADSSCSHGFLDEA